MYRIQLADDCCSKDKLTIIGQRSSDSMMGKNEMSNIMNDKAVD